MCMYHLSRFHPGGIILGGSSRKWVWLYILFYTTVPSLGGGGSFSPPPPPPPMKPCLPYVEHLHVCQLCYDRLNLPFSLPRGLYPGKEEILCVYFSARFTRSLIDERITNPSATRFSSKFLHHMFKLCVEFPLKAHHLNTHMLSSQWLPE